MYIEKLGSMYHHKYDSLKYFRDTYFLLLFSFLFNSFILLFSTTVWGAKGLWSLWPFLPLIYRFEI